MMRLLIPSLLIYVPVYEREKGTNGQDIVDAPDSAAMWHWNQLSVIADHASQNFSRLYKTKVGATAFLGKKKYKCVSTEIGRIQNNRLYRANGRFVHEDWKTGLCIYTCYGQKIGSIQPVKLTHWSAVK
jgi:hypothetical protein